MGTALGGRARPAPGDCPAAAGTLLLVPVVPVALGAVRLVRDVEALPLRDRITAWAAYPLAVIVACLLLAGLSTGGIGDGRLGHLGPQMSTLALPLIGLVAVTTALVLGVLATPLIPWTRGAVASLRERVEAAERSERGETQRGTRGETGHGEHGQSTGNAHDTDAESDVPDAGTRAPGSAGTASSAGSAGSAGSADDTER